MPQRIEGNRALIPTAEVCEKTGFSLTYIQRLLREERIEGIKVGSVWLVYEDSLKAFIDQPRKRGRPHKETIEATSDRLDTSSPEGAKARSANNGEGQKTEGRQHT
jgi:excisionase family DNA binding protein